MTIQTVKGSTLGFQAIQTFTVGTGGEYSTINAALRALSNTTNTVSAEGIVFQ